MDSFDILNRSGTDFFSFTDLKNPYLDSQSQAAWMATGVRGPITDRVWDSAWRMCGGTSAPIYLSCGWFTILKRKVYIRNQVYIKSGVSFWRLRCVAMLIWQKKLGFPCRILVVTTWKLEWSILICISYEMLLWCTILLFSLVLSFSNCTAHSHWHCTLWIKVGNRYVT